LRQVERKTNRGTTWFVTKRDLNQRRGPSKLPTDQTVRRGGNAAKQFNEIDGGTDRRPRNQTPQKKKIGRD